MESDHLKRLHRNIEVLKSILTDKEVKKLDFDLLQRVIMRLNSFDCNECGRYLQEIDEHTKMLIEKGNPVDKSDFKEYHKKISGIISHLEKEHKLVREGYYMSVYMSIGMSIGLVFGLAVFENNIALGLPIGMSIGIAIGSGLDADAKKKGRII